MWLSIPNTNIVKPPSSSTMPSGRRADSMEIMMRTLWSQASPIIFKRRGFRAVVLVGLWLWSQLLPGCAQSAHQSGRDLLDKILPDQIQEQVDQSVSFAD